MAVAIALAMAPAAHANTTDFIHWMDAHGEQVTGSTDIVAASIDLGYATCGLLKVQTYNEAVTYMVRNDGDYSKANRWVVGSTNFLCPEYLYKLP